MNWVGGSRNRLVMRNDAKKQREFFEKRRMQQKLKKLGAALPSSTPTNTADPPKVAVFGRCSGGSKYRRHEPIVLPMSPCSPSKLSLVESQSQLSVQEPRKIKNVIQQRFKHQQLSPVLESAFSDNSASDYLPPMTDLPSPSSSTSSTSSGQGLFHLQMNPQNQRQTQFQALPQYSPPPWENSLLQQTKFQPFSKPRLMRDAISKSCKSNSPHFQLETPTAAQTLFGSPFPDKTEEMECGGDASTFFLKQPEDKEPMLDFTHNQSDYKHLFVEEAFRVFGNEEEQREDSHFGSGNSKIYLPEENSLRSATPQTISDPGSVGVELCNCTAINSSCVGRNTGPVNGCESSPCYSCTAGYLSSDSNDDERCWDSCRQETASQLNQACSDNFITSSQWNHRPFQPGSHTPQSISRVNLRHEHKVLGNMASSYKVQQMENNETLSSSSGPQAENSELCQCRKVSPESQEAGTQTEHVWTPESCDASTQYSFVADNETKTSDFSFYQPDTDLPQQNPATDAYSEPQSVSASSKNSTSEENQALWGKNSKAGSLAGNNVAHKFTASNSPHVFPRRPTNPLSDFIDSRGKEKERGQQENSTLKDEEPAVVKAVKFDTRTSGVSQEDETLQEIADILLLLKQRRKEE